MFHLAPLSAAGKEEFYAQLHEQAAALLSGERSFIANAANLASLLYWTMPQINWAGFYLFDGGKLVLGPFHGKPACTRIAIGRGVCGTAAQERRTIVVPDVHAFPGHIACDADSRSEIVIPLLRDDSLLGVLDIDSPIPARFDPADARSLQRLAALLVEPATTA